MYYRSVTHYAYSEGLSVIMITLYKFKFAYYNETVQLIKINPWIWP